MKTLTCQRCGKTFDGHGNCKYCDVCRIEHRAEQMRECQRKYRVAHREQIREADRKWREAYPEKCREYRRKYNAANRKKCRERCRRYYAEHRDEINAWNKKVRAARRRSA